MDEMEHPDVTGSAESGLSESATRGGGGGQQKTNKVEQQVYKCVRECVALVKLAVSNTVNEIRAFFTEDRLAPEVG